MVFLLELYQLSFFFSKFFIIWRNISLEFPLKVIFRRWMFRGDSKHLILNRFCWGLSKFIMMFFFELYQFFFFFFKTLIIWRNISLSFFSKWSAEDGCSEVRVSTSFWMGPDKNFFNSSWCSSLKSINYSSCFSKLWSNGESLAWNSLSKWYVEDGSSKVRVSTSFWMGPGENCLDLSWCSSLNSIYSSSCFSNFDQTEKY